MVMKGLFKAAFLHILWQSWAEDFAWLDRRLVQGVKWIVQEVYGKYWDFVELGYDRAALSDQWRKDGLVPSERKVPVGNALDDG